MTVQYQGVWSLQSAAQLQSTQRWVTDPLFDYTTLLLQADDAGNGAQNNTFLDSSSNNFTITRNGNTTQGSFTPFSLQPGAWGNFFGGSGNYLKTGTLSAISTTATTFTVECWVYMTQLPSGNIPVTIGDLAPDSNTANWSFGPIDSGKVRFYWFTGSGLNAEGNTVLALNTWHHIAVSISSATISIYVNGVKESLTGTTTLTNRSSTLNYIGFGQRSAGGEIFYGYVSNARIVSGAALYSGNVIAVPSTPLGVASSGTTQLITCQSNRFLDNSSNAVSITPTGSSMTVQPFSPFAPQFQWTPSVIGGSGYFDGTGDFLNFTGSISLTGQFAAECWFYRMGSAAQQTLFAFNSNSSSYASVRVDTDQGNVDRNLTVNLSTTGSSWAGTFSVNSIYNKNAWNHLVVTRDASNNVRLFLNGVLINTVSAVAGTLTSASTTQALGCNTLPGTATNTFNGYISDIRLVNGSIPTTYQTSSTTTNAVIFTPPSAPMTTTSQGATSSNVSLLTNFTNAGIYDGTMKNNLETVGNASVSTAVVKYGSGSMYFDGNGDYLTAPNLGGQFDFRTGDFTIEFWLYAPSGIASFADTIISKGPPGVVDFTSWAIQGNGSNGNIDFMGPFSTIYATTSSTPWVNGWTHIAMCRSSAGTRCFVNGVQVGSTYTTLQDFLAGGPLIVGSGYYDPPGRSMNGYLDDVRITKGIARYTQNFIPPSVALPRQ